MVKYVKASKSTVSYGVSDNNTLEIWYGNAIIAEVSDVSKDLSDKELESMVDEVLSELGYTWNADGTLTDTGSGTVNASKNTSGKYVKASNEYHTEVVNGHEIEYYNEVPEVAYECADIIADEIEKVNIMNFTEIEERIHEISGLDYDTIFDIELDKYVYELLHFRGIDQNYSDGDFFTIEYGDSHPELKDE